MHKTKKQQPENTLLNPLLKQMQNLALEILSDTVSEENLSVQAKFYSGAQVERHPLFSRPFKLQFSMEKGAANLAYLNSGNAPVLDSHQDDSVRHVIGVVEKAWIEKGVGMASLRFSDREDVKPIWRDVQNKIVRNISMGVKILKAKDVTPKDSEVTEVLATEWEPLEISTVAIGADSGAFFMASDQRQMVEVEIQRAEAQEEIMEEQLKSTDSGTVADPKPDPVAAAPAVDLAAIQAEATKNERLRIDGIQKSVKLAGLDEKLSAEMVSKGTTLADARTEIFTKLAEKSEANPTRSSAVVVTRDADVSRIAAMSNQLLHRLGPDKVKLEEGRQYVNFTLFDLTKEVLSSHGISFSGRSKLDVVDLAYQTTSDFPNLIGNVAHTRLRQAYEEVLPTYSLWARRAPNAPDFKAMTVIQLGGAPDLLRVNEHGEFKYAKVSDGAETYSMVTYGRILAFTRQAIINDDLRGFDRITTGFGSAAARLENRTVYAELTANAVLSDGVALFHATHGNLVSPGTVINVANLGIARGKMRAQTGVNGEALNLVPRYLIVPAAQEQVAYQYTSNQFVPATPANTNEFRQGGRTALEVIVDGLLDATSTTAWYLAADSSAIDTVEYAFLDGNEGVFLEQRKGFNIDGMEFKARLDFAASKLDYRGLVRNDGA